MNPPADSIVRFASFGFVLALLSSVGQTFFIGLFGGELQLALGIDAARWGLLYGLATLCSGGLMFWAGAQVDHRPLKQVLAMVLALLLLGALLMAATSSLWMLLVALFLLRFGGQGLAGHLAMVVAARPAQRRGRSLSIAAFGFISGEALLPISVVALLASLGWRGLWWSTAAVTLLAIPLLWCLATRIEPMTKVSGQEPAHGPLLDRRSLLGNPAFLAALSVILVSPFVVTALFLQQASIIALKGWSLPMFASGFLLFAVAQGASNWLSGALVDRYGALLLFRVYLIPLGLACLSLAWLSGYSAMWLLFAGLGVTAGAQGVLGGALWVQLFGLRQLGLVRGVYFGFMVLMTALSPFLLGMALSAAIPLVVLASLVAVYALLTPWLAARVLARTERQRIATESAR